MWTASLLLVAALVNAQNLSDDTINVLVSARLADGAKASWELGTRTQAILSLNATSFSVLTPSTRLPPSDSVPDNLTAALSPLFDIARTVVQGRAKSNNDTVGPQPLIQDGSAADPASIGMAVLLANWTARGAQDGVDYAGAARDQLDFLFENVPKTPDGAISHRVSEVQLWSDFVYMVPPFLAYYGVLTHNRTLLTQAYTQIKLYRAYLRDTDRAARGLWKHVLLGTATTTANDEGHWSTGNAWAAAGMLRVLGTILNSEFANAMKNERKDLVSWVREIHDGMYPFLDRDVLLFANYASQPASASGNFYDAASTALMAATVYRLSLLAGVHTWLPVAEKSRMALSAPSNNDTSPTPSSTSSSSSPSSSLSTSSSPSSSLSASSSSSVPTSSRSSTSSAPSPTATSPFAHLTSQGWLTPVVNPHSYGQEGANSPEAQAFVVEMHAAWRDWIADGAKGANAATAVRPSLEIIFVAVVCAVVGLV